MGICRSTSCTRRAPERKRPLPYIPQVIGIVTSPTGAVIRDILHRLADRFPRHVLVWPVAVQGEAAAAQIAAAVAGFNALPAGGLVPRPDLLIVARGGGSVEDLWAFNEEIVVRAVAASAIPVITAVGHETDTTLVDYAGDHRAPTPTAAAERAVPVLADLRFTLGSLGLRNDRGLGRGLVLRAERTAAVAKRLPSARTLLGLRQQRFDDLAERLPRALRSAAAQWQARLARTASTHRPRLLARTLSASADRLTRGATALGEAKRRMLARDRQLLTAQSARVRPFLLGGHVARAEAALATQARLLDTLSPLGVLARGYAVVRAPGGTLINTAAAARRESALTLQFADASMEATPVRQGRLL